jgi:hypothetical protein
MLPSLARTSPRMRLDSPSAPQSRAVFAGRLATSCRFLPLLPPITPHVKLSDRANRLELVGRADPARAPHVKSGKNGNGDHPSQHCRNLQSTQVDFVAVRLQAPFQPPARFDVAARQPFAAAAATSVAVRGVLCYTQRCQTLVTHEGSAPGVASGQKRWNAPSRLPMADTSTPCQCGHTSETAIRGLSARRHLHTGLDERGEFAQVTH